MAVHIAGIDPEMLLLASLSFTQQFTQQFIKLVQSLVREILRELKEMGSQEGVALILPEVEQRLCLVPARFASQLQDSILMQRYRQRRKPQGAHKQQTF